MLKGEHINGSVTHQQRIKPKEQDKQGLHGIASGSHGKSLKNRIDTAQLHRS